MLDNVPDLLTLKQLMTVLHIGKNSALSLIHEGQIEGHLIAGKWVVCKEDVIEYILRH